MTGKEDASSLGGCGLFMLVTSFILILVSLAGSLLARFYLHAFYTAAHAAILAAISATFVWAHHVFRFHKALQMDLMPYYIIQCILNCLYFMCTLALTVFYILVCLHSTNTNVDCIAASCWVSIATVLILYLLISTCSGVISRAGDYQESAFIRNNSFLGRRKRFADTARLAWKEQTIPLREHTNTNSTPSYPVSRGARASSDDSLNSVRSQKSCCSSCCSIFVWFFYILLHVILLTIFALSAYNAAFVVKDTMAYKDPDLMVTVNVDNHLPLALYIQCAGNGSETILFENGLGGTVFMSWDFVPKLLASNPKYRVCAYDRRGYGWSEGLEYDYPWVEEPQWVKSNIEYLEELVRRAKIPAPFYYVGHSYGGMHLTYMAIKYPHLIKGLVYLDSVGFSVLETIDNLDIRTILLNIQPTGGLRVFLSIINEAYEEGLSEFIDLENITKKLVDNMKTTFISTYYLATLDREMYYVMENDQYVSIRMREITTGAEIDKPVLVIDANTKAEFAAKEIFTQYDEQRHLLIEDATHDSLVLTLEHGRQVAQYIDQFIKDTSKR